MKTLLIALSLLVSFNAFTFNEWCEEPLTSLKNYHNNMPMIPRVFPAQSGNIDVMQEVLGKYFKVMGKTKTPIVSANKSLQWAYKMGKITNAELITYGNTAGKNKVYYFIMKLDKLWPKILEDPDFLWSNFLQAMIISTMASSWAEYKNDTDPFNFVVTIGTGIVIDFLIVTVTSAPPQYLKEVKEEMLKQGVSKGRVGKWLDGIKQKFNLQDDYLKLINQGASEFRPESLNPVGFKQKLLYHAKSSRQWAGKQIYETRLNYQKFKQQYVDGVVESYRSALNGPLSVNSLIDRSSISLTNPAAPIWNSGAQNLIMWGKRFRESSGLLFKSGFYSGLGAGLVTYAGQQFGLIPKEAIPDNYTWYADPIHWAMHLGVSSAARGAGVNSWIDNIKDRLRQRAYANPAHMRLKIFTGVKTMAIHTINNYIGALHWIAYRESGWDPMVVAFPLKLLWSDKPTTEENPVPTTSVPGPNPESFPKPTQIQKDVQDIIDKYVAPYVNVEKIDPNELEGVGRMLQYHKQGLEAREALTKERYTQIADKYFAECEGIDNEDDYKKCIDSAKRKTAQEVYEISQQIARDAAKKQTNGN